MKDPQVEPKSVSRAWGKVAKGVLGCVVAGGLFLATEWLATAFLSRDGTRAAVPVPAIILVGLSIGLAAIATGYYLVRQWLHPAWRLRNLLDEARQGTLPLNQFPKAMGGLSPLMPMIRGLCEDLRQSRGEVAALNQEMSLKVAQRTDALERLAGKLQTQATRDVLTGLFNRRMLDQCLDDLVQRCMQDRRPLCLMMIDVDDFKLLNDTLGHAAGDTLLRAIGQLVRSTARQQDLAFRCGGDEFVVILPHSARSEGEALAKRLGELVDALVKPLMLARKPRLSIGMTTLADLMGIATGPELLADADRRLYAIKTARKAAMAKAESKDRAA